MFGRDEQEFVVRGFLLFDFGFSIDCNELSFSFEGP